MISRRSPFVLLLCFWLGACATPERQGDSVVSDAAVERQVLVMLHSAPPHFRPDVNYAGGGYDSRLGRDARRRTAEAVARDYHLRIVDDWPMPALGVDCFVMEALDQGALPRLIEPLSRDPRIESAQSMNLFHVLIHNDPLYPLQPGATLWDLASVHQITTGRNVAVAEIDSGVETDHPDLKGRIAATRNFVDSRQDVAEFHGTAVAGIIAARADNGIGIAGMAPEAKLLALRACWQSTGRTDAVCSSFTLAKALQFALDESSQVINLSIGGPRDPLLGRLIDIALARGVTVVGAVDPLVTDGGFPASHHGVLAVAGDDAHDAPEGSLFAPGRDVPTTVPGRGWRFVNGSSFAAAHVTGLVALLKELAPNLRPPQIREALLPEIGPMAERHPVVDACAAITRIARTCACACAMARDANASLPR